MTIPTTVTIGFDGATVMSASHSHPRFVAIAATALAFLALCLWPYLERLRSPSLYADDVVRVAQLQTGTLAGIAFVPFNEHIAPLFQVVSWASWQLAGRTLAHAPLAFTLASFLPFLPTLGLLAWIIRRETRSTTASLASVAVFSLSWLAIESVYWYSASSFLWSLLATLVAWLAAADSDRKGGWRYGIVAALASAAAPAFSAIGLLAGPVAAVRVVAAPGGRWRAALAPLSGTLLTLILYAALHDRAALASNLGQSAGVGPGLLTAARAPTASLVPALFGLRTWSASGFVVWLQVALTMVAILALLIRARRQDDRPLILGGLALIVGGYVLTFCARAGESGRSLLETQRYHLFPMLGLVFVLTAVFRRSLTRWDSRPLDGLRAATALAAVLFVLHHSEMKGRARFLRYPDQARTLAAIDRLGAVCTGSKISRAEALAALDPIETAWTPPGYNALIVLAEGEESGGVPRARIKATLLSALTPEERRSVCGGMDATPYLSGGEGPLRTVAIGRQVALYRIRESEPGRYVSSGWPSFIEYELSGSSPPDARALRISGSDPVDVWWRGDRQRWSETRSVRLRPEPGHASLLPLDQLPHWNPAEARRLRLLYHAPGPLAVSAPKLVR